MKDIEKIEGILQPGALSGPDIAVLVQNLKDFEDGDIYVEIGVMKGRSLSLANHILQDNNKIYGIDVNKDDELVNYLNKNKKVNFIWADSVFVASVWNVVSGGQIKLIFIDGNHSYEGCRRDILAWYPHMKIGGIMLFHDYDITSPGVIKAVDEFVKIHNFKLEVSMVGKSSIAKIQL